MLNTVEFSENWNGKLLLDYFTSIRLATDKYVDGNVYEIMLKGELLGKAKLTMIHPFPFRSLNERTALIDCGRGLHYLKTLLSRFYGQRLIPETTLYLLFFHWVERRYQAQTRMFKEHWEKCTEQMPKAVQQHMIFTD